MNYQVSALFLSKTNDSRNWLLGFSDDLVSLPLDGTDNGLFTGSFVPPPPRPLYLEDGVPSDGLTTCDLCSWAWQNGNSHTLDNSLESSSKLGWVLTLIIVSLTSAILGATVMIIVLQLRRLKNSLNNNETVRTPPPKDKIDISPTQAPPSPPPQSGIWAWLSRRAATPSQLQNPSLSFVENHYTHMDDPYTTPDDALYAELDSETRDSNPAYQNSAYTDSDAPTSSAPSSAYYSDLSVITDSTERVYEVVGLASIGRKGSSLAVINESLNVPADYV